MIKVLVSDLDGTVTDPATEVDAFMAAYLDDLTDVTRLPFERVQDIVRSVATDMAECPTHYDWEFGGQRVCSMLGDPYLRILPIANAILDEAATYTVVDERHDLLRRLLGKHYPMSSVFRPGTKRYLTELGIPVHVVTNTKTDKAAHRLSGLFVSDDSRLATVLANLRGDAKKQVIDPDFDQLPESATFQGFHRPVLLRRRQYFSVLDAVRNLHGAMWNEVVVVGDNLELDLSVPYMLGARVVLVANQNTPAWEIAFMRQHGVVITSLDEVSALLQP